MKNLFTLVIISASACLIFASQAFAQTPVQDAYDNTPESGLPSTGLDLWFLIVIGSCLLVGGFFATRLNKER